MNMARTWAFLRVLLQVQDDPMGDRMQPDRKVTAGALAGALTAIGAWVLAEFGGVTLPPEIAVAIATVFTFVTSYFVKPTEPAPPVV